jgi:hypothetical protein
MNSSSNVTVTAHETKAMEHVRQTMRHRYPNVPAATISERMHKEHQRYDNARIRDFVPLLVERELTAQLRAATGADPRSEPISG